MCYAEGIELLLEVRFEPSNLPQNMVSYGATENARHEIVAQPKLRGMKLRDMKLRHKTTRREIARHEIVAQNCTTWNCETWNCGTKLHDMKLRDMKLWHQFVRHERESKYSWCTKILNKNSAYNLYSNIERFFPSTETLLMGFVLCYIAISLCD